MSCKYSGCIGLESIIVETGNTKYDSRDNCNAIIATSSNTLIAGCKNTAIPNSVTSIAEYAFYGCSGLTSVTIPNSVTKIDSWALWDCSGLESIIVEAGNTKYDSRDNCNAIIETSSNTLIAGCKSTIIPNSVTSIGSNAFLGCSGLTSITIGNSVTSIGSYAFDGCTGLTSVSIPESVTSIVNGAFYACSGLRDVYCYAENIPSTDTNIFSYLSISSATLHVPATSLARYAATSPWSKFGSIVPIGSIEPNESSFVLTDGESYTNDKNTEYNEITYTRTFSNTDWQALYVPYALNYEDWSADFDVARLNNANQYDDDEDGVVDRTVLESFFVRNGQTLPNTPYLIRAKEAGEKTIVTENATLYKAEENSFDVSSWNTKFTFTGTYSGVSGAEMFTNGYYAMGGGRLHQAESSAYNLNPMRWYMTVTDRNGNPKSLGEVKVMVFGDDTDGISPTENAEKTENTEVYDLSGRRTDKPTKKGVYIKNGRKMIVR